MAANLRYVRTLEAFRQRHTIPEDLPPISSDEDLVEWGQRLIGKSAEQGRRRQPLRAVRVREEPAEPVKQSVEQPRRRKPLRAVPKRSGVLETTRQPEPEPAPQPKRRNAETMTLDELFDEIAARATGAHRGARLRAIR